MSYEKLMKACLDLAKKGSGKTLTNPMVGAILIRDGEILSKGYHRSFYDDHAEIDCFKNLKEDCEGATLIVNLEPCSHYGKHPPCVDEVIKRGVKKVVIANTDTNPKVDGIKKLREAGIELVTGVLEDEARALNYKFFFNMKYKRPIVSLKYAQSLDGKIATKSYDSNWITNEKSRHHVHKLRSEYDAILIGKNTLIKDRARLTSRIEGGIDPVRVIVSNDLDIPKDLEIFRQKSDKKTYIATLSDKKTDIDAEILTCREKNGSVDLKDLLSKLYKINIGSVLVEGGSLINYSFLKEDLVDKAYIFTAPIIIGGDGRDPFIGEGSGEIKDARKFSIENIRRFDEDMMVEVKNVYRNIG